MTKRNAFVVNDKVTLQAERFSVPVEQIDFVSLDGSEDAGSGVYVFVRFSQTTEAGKAVRFSTAVGDALKCIRWFEEAKAARR